MPLTAFAYVFDPPSTSMFHLLQRFGLNNLTKGKDTALLQTKNFLQEQQQQLEQLFRQGQHQPQVLGGPSDNITQGQGSSNMGLQSQGELLLQSKGIQQKGALSEGAGYVQRWPHNRVLEQPGTATAWGTSIAPGGIVCQPQGTMGWVRCSICGRAGHLPAECPCKVAAFPYLAGAASRQLLVSGMNTLFSLMSSQEPLRFGSIPAHVYGGGCSQPPPSFIPSSYISQAIHSAVSGERKRIITPPWSRSRPYQETSRLYQQQFLREMRKGALTRGLEQQWAPLRRFPRWHDQMQQHFQPKYLQRRRRQE